MSLEKPYFDSISTSEGQLDLFLDVCRKKCWDIICSNNLHCIWYKYEDFFTQADMTSWFYTWKRTVTNDQMFLDVPLETARRFYKEMMERSYKVREGWWSSKDRIPTCWFCNEKILTCKDLRRFNWISTHWWECAKQHFSKMISNNMDKNSINYRFFERVSEL